MRLDAEPGDGGASQTDPASGPKRDVRRAPAGVGGEVFDRPSEGLAVQLSARGLRLDQHLRGPDRRRAPVADPRGNGAGQGEPAGKSGQRARKPVASKASGIGIEQDSAAPANRATSGSGVPGISGPASRIAAGLRVARLSATCAVDTASMPMSFARASRSRSTASRATASEPGTAEWSTTILTSNPIHRSTANRTRPRSCPACPEIIA
jgi:hypothetical protein